MFRNIYVNCKGDYGKEIKKEVSGIVKNLRLKVTGNAKKADLAILIGGDGTLFREQSDMHCPVLGINPGKSVGFYMMADGKDFRAKVVKVLSGKHGKDYFVHSLMRLETKINGKALPALALNDVLINPVYVRRILDTELIAGIKRSVERNSGIIIYTPTGSHAFAASAGAKPLEWDEKIFGIAALAPYDGMLKKGELFAEKQTIRARVLSDEGEVCIDGQEDQVFGLKKDDVVQVSKSILPARIVGFADTFKKH